MHITSLLLLLFPTLANLLIPTCITKRFICIPFISLFCDVWAHNLVRVKTKIKWFIITCYTRASHLGDTKRLRKRQKHLQASKSTYRRIDGILHTVPPIHAYYTDGGKYKLYVSNLINLPPLTHVTLS